MALDAKDQAMAGLIAFGEMRVWSVIITIFGDAVEPRGGTVAATTLGAITERLGIKPEALRVALYRLVKDGWIERRKSGRNSFYTLSRRGQAEFLPAKRRIYATGPMLTGPWRVAVLPAPDETVARACEGAGYLRLAPTVFLGSDAAGAPPPGVLEAAPLTTALPDWGRAALGPAQVAADYLRLGTFFAELEVPADPLDACALRILMVHHWRRVLLRHADVPAQMLPQGWQGETCRAMFLSRHAALSVVADPWLNTEIGG